MKTVQQVLDKKGRSLCSIGPNARVLDALRAMSLHAVGAMVVVDGGRLVGILSERDFARQVARSGHCATHIAVREIMTRRVTTIAVHETVEACMSLMVNGNFRHLPVLERGELVGMLSIGDLVREIIADQAATIRHLETYIQG
ncbi:inosine-5-monophosphate dehydrogenase [Pandoraea terrae]|uniref:Inosine-5-monophosphate dehydrogenase n=1 Tax=Pandoraea terrae TaxID=1537710 RepID=A0A5E4T538_9BURK|nr:CBS domain-containing protein [Pandoraea terrae]VVD81564.1 inosine-5-monophosphate dehydrogenase [Pandoraea terrae]